MEIRPDWFHLVEIHSRVEASVKLAWRLISDNDLDAAVDRIVDSNYEIKSSTVYIQGKRRKRRTSDEIFIELFLLAFV